MQQHLKRVGQAGVVLPVVLIFLVVMMILGVTAIRNITLDEKVAANSRSHIQAFQAAEQGLRSCESLLLRGIVNKVNILQAGPLPNGRNYWEDNANWGNANSFEVPLAASEANLNTQLAARPRCMVEAMDGVASRVSSERKQQFRITSRGVGLRNTSVVILQSYLVLI